LKEPQKTIPLQSNLISLPSKADSEDDNDDPFGYLSSTRRKQNKKQPFHTKQNQ
jgi:hypothetical protein